MLLLFFKALIPVRWQRSIRSSKSQSRFFCNNSCSEFLQFSEKQKASEQYLVSELNWSLLCCRFSLKSLFNVHTGLLSQLGRSGEKPYAPLNLVADFAGGGLTCALGIILALLERTKSGKGQIIDASMVEGAAFTGSFLWKSRKLGLWSRPRGENLLDSGAPFYDTYKTLDGKYLAVGAIETEFYNQLLKGLELDAGELPPQMSFSDWPELKQLFTERFASKTQADWLMIFDGTDACVTPVLSLDQVSSHPHNRERGSFMKDSSGEEFPRPAPVLSRTPAEPCLASDPAVGEHTVEVLLDYGYTSAEIDEMLAAGVVQCSAGKAKL
ncbi:PREDICTED: alpha-methylacyl-CoA racemase [Poecilia mexicana]|nr:PREDICTED: alpha-methylacyl-CoA racemase [Poecilia mexicana]